eukprot:gene16011-biopygen8215
MCSITPPPPLPAPGGRRPRPACRSMRPTDSVGTAMRPISQREVRGDPPRSRGDRAGDYPFMDRRHSANVTLRSWHGAEKRHARRRGGLSYWRLPAKQLQWMGRWGIAAKHGRRLSYRCMLNIIDIALIKHRRVDPSALLCVMGPKRIGAGGRSTLRGLGFSCVGGGSVLAGLSSVCPSVYSSQQGSPVFWSPGFYLFWPVGIQFQLFCDEQLSVKRPTTVHSNERLMTPASE